MFVLWHIDVIWGQNRGSFLFTKNGFTCTFSMCWLAVWHTVRPYCEVMWGQGQGYLQVRGGWEGWGLWDGVGVGGLASTMVPGLQGCKTTWGKTHCKRSRRCQLHFHDLSVFKVTRTEVITLPSLTIVHYDHSHFLVCLFYDLPLSHCKQKTFNNSLRASLRLQVYGLFDAQ